MSRSTDPVARIRERGWSTGTHRTQARATS